MRARSYPSGRLEEVKVGDAMGGPYTEMIVDAYDTLDPDFFEWFKKEAAYRLIPGRQGCLTKR